MIKKNEVEDDNNK